MAAPTHEATAVDILNIIASYGVHCEREPGSWDAFDVYLPTVTKQVAAGIPVRILLPAFPFKQDSDSVVLGPLPDLGEELALARLQGLCDDISTVYETGAEVLICSDGLVYHDLMGVSVDAAWEFGEALRAMATRIEAHSIKFIRLWDLLDHPSRHLHQESPEKAKAYYLEHGACIRRELLYRFSDVDFDATVALATDKAWATTHASYVGVLSKKATENPDNIAKQMMVRGKAYARGLNAVLPDYLRLSIHDSAGKDKLSLAMVPPPHERASVGLMPWRSVVAIDSDGSYRTVFPDQIKDTHELIYRNGQPYFFREKSELFDWSSSGIEVTFEPLYPCGTIIRPVEGSPSVRQIPMQKVRQLATNFSPVILRGFGETLDEEVWLNKGHELGKPVTDPALHNPPGYQYSAYLATARKGGDYSLFCNSRLFFRYLPLSWPLEKLEPITWKVTSDSSPSSANKGLPLVVRHPVTNAPCLRWRSFNNDTTHRVQIENEEQTLVNIVEKLARDPRTCLRFTWEKGDLLVNDNISTPHVRTSNAETEIRLMYLN
ncbi:Pyoverdine/dityrosine biosynthesis protein-domain-containing protein [Xylaria bambusicola]|uniref:Pyoverdine/dityrosine biosynthesis protein-domain-containing protein n=1 Tax=Xylaria bambusicola TaxID=326684 RepID=UPI002007924C|nr:Pyoverdine/dityrosine biosynthesis protein-domain-containing protein [Xylaria bambusicola]KAI0522108.1 Pyoverdine/dityrosine biosynthesis protein-domain-containing protein [Xylaria bambusicola]